MKNRPSPDAEFGEIRALYAVGRLAAEVLGDRLEQSELASDRQTQTNFNVLVSERGLTCKAVQRALDSGRHLGRLREVLFVRMVSALEVYLIDSVRQLFLHRKDLFHKDEKVEFQYRELLAARSLNQIFGHLISRECRRLQNQGFSAVRKYYLQRFSIDFDKAKGATLLDEMHERRHLLVHRLGATDLKYRKAYKTRETKVGVPEDYLIQAIEAAESLGIYVRREIRRLSVSARDAPLDARLFNVRVEIAEVEPSAEPILDPGFLIKTERLTFQLRDILRTETQEGRERDLVLSGAWENVNAYMKRLRGEQKRGALAIRRTSVLTSGYRCKLTEAQFAAVAELVPPEPWPQGLHRTIAEKLDLSNKQVHFALDILVGHPNSAQARGATINRQSGG